MNIIDYLDYREFSKSVLNIVDFEIHNNIMLFGNWGTGKTTIINCLEHESKLRGDYHVVKFNPWINESSSNLLLPLLRELFYSLPKSVRVTEETKTILKSLTALFLDLGIRAVTKTATFGMAQLKASDVDRVVEEYENILDKEDDKVHQCQELFTDFVQKTLSKTKKVKYLILLDDLDRCLPENVISLIESVKIYLANIEQLPLTFIWAMDRDIVVESITKKYDLISFSGKDYLEKIFDKQMSIPEFNNSKIQAFFNGLYLNSKHKSKIDLLFENTDMNMHLGAINILPLRNPRKLRRVWSNIEFISDNWNDFKKKAVEIELYTNTSDINELIKNMMLGLIISYCFNDWRTNVLDHFDTWPTFIRNNKEVEISEGSNNILTVLDMFKIINYSVDGNKFHCNINEEHLKFLSKISSLFHHFCL